MVTVIRMVIRKTLRILWFVLSAATPLHDRAGCLYNDSVTTQADGIYQQQKAEFMTKHMTKHMTNRMTDSTSENRMILFSNPWCVRFAIGQFCGPCMGAQPAPMHSHMQCCVRFMGIRTLIPICCKYVWNITTTVKLQNEIREWISNTCFSHSCLIL